MENTCALYKEKIDKAIAKALENLGENSPLIAAGDYALFSGGKRIRPLLTLLIAQGVGKNFDVMDAAISVELFHTASIIADDLPCMDNDDSRRSKPALHKEFGESVAILASYTLISLAYELIGKNAESAKKYGVKTENLCSKAIQLISQCAGVQGATQGQFLDLFPPNDSIEMLLQIIHKKTVTLFEIAFIFGWLFGGGDADKIEKIRKASHHFGLAFQLVDDVQDMQQDENKFNIAAKMGLEKTIDLIENEISSAKQELFDLNLLSTPILELLNTLLSKGKEPIATI